MGNSSRTFLLFALIIIYASILPVFSLQNNIGILSHGTVDYSGLPPPSPNTWNLDITVTPANSGKAVIVDPINVDVQKIPVAQNITVSAIPNQGYSFVNWKLDNVAFTQNPILVGPYSAGSTHTLVATFTIANLPKESYVGFRSNGEDSVDYWVSVANRYTALIPGTVPVGQWILPEAKAMTFDSTTDSMLTALDNAGVKVFLQPGEDVKGIGDPYEYSIDDLIDGTLQNYGHHSSVIGFGIDIEMRVNEWFEVIPITDIEATRWVNKIQGYDSDYKLFLKHFSQWVMPPTVRSGIIFIDDSQGFDSLASMVDEFKRWGSSFSQADVGFGVGYLADEWWWSQLANPPRDIAQALFQNIPNAKWVYWVNFSVHDVFP